MTGEQGLPPARCLLLGFEMTQAEALASKMLALTGVRAIWDINLAAGAAYRMGRPDLAKALVDIADAAEREWMSRAEFDAGAPI